MVIDSTTAPASCDKPATIVNVEQSNSDSSEPEEFETVTYKGKRKHNNRKEVILTGISDVGYEFRALIVKRKKWFDVSRIPLDVNRM